MIRLLDGEMERLIEALGGSPGKNGRTRCFLHGGENPTSFSYTPEGLWYCFAEGRGGDAVELVMEARGCTFREALEFMAELGIREAEEALQSTARQRRIRQELQERRALAEKALLYGRALWKLVDGSLSCRPRDGDLDLYLDLYLEVSRHYEALKKKAWAADRETGEELLRMRGAAQRFLSILDLSPDRQRLARAVLTWPELSWLIHELRARRVFSTKRRTAQAA